MTMAPIYEHHDYYKKMLELQEKLRKSEEERIRLEERFNLLAQETKNRHGECINRLRLRYIEYLEEQRARDERNHNLLGALDKVDNSLAEMTAKTRRLNVLRKQYEAYLLRTYRRNAAGATGSSVVDSGVGSQTERNDKVLKSRHKEDTVLARLQTGDVLSRTEPSTQSIDRVGSERFSSLKSPIRIEIQPDVNNRQNPQEFPCNVQPHSANISRDNGMLGKYEFPEYVESHEKFNSATNVRPFSARRLQQTQDHRSPRFYGGSNADNNPELLTNSPKNVGRQSFSLRSHEMSPDKNWHSLYGQPTVSAYDEGVRNRTTRVLEDELERYIENIKSLHRADLESGSIEDELDHDHDQNTSGDLLNVTLSDEGDAREENFADKRQSAQRKERRKGKEERLPSEVKGILALATDLASRTVEDSEETKVGACETNGKIQTRLPRVEENNKTSELNYTRCNTENKILESNSKTAEIFNDKNLLMGEISEVDKQDFHAVEELEPWDLKFVEKQIKEIRLDEVVNENKELLTNVNAENEESPEIRNVQAENVENNLEESDSTVNVNGNQNEQNLRVVNPENSSVKENVSPEFENSLTKGEMEGSESVDYLSTYKNVQDTEVLEENVNQNEELNNQHPHDDKGQNEYSNIDETNVNQNWQDGVNSTIEYEGYAQNPVEESGNENYVAQEEYNNEEYQQNSNTVYEQESNQGYAYDYDQGYENDPNQTYENNPDQSYGNDLNASYQNEANQYYQGDANKSYENDPGGVYETDPNQHYEVDHNQHYEIDPNQHFEADGNEHYEIDPNQHYEGDSNEQFESGANQHYSTDPNQAYQNDPNQQYESDQVYSNDPNQSYQNDPNHSYETSHVEENAQQQGNVVENESDETDVNPPAQIQETEENSEKISERVGDQTESQDNSKIEKPNESKKKKDVIRSLLDSDTESTIERNVSNTDSDFDFN